MTSLRYVAKILPPEASLRNPLDMIASATPKSYAAAMTALGVSIVCYAIYALLRRDTGTRISPHWAWLAGFAGGIHLPF